jgi:hypothetical protein
MAVIVTRAGKGSPLTSSEVDANFTNLDTYIDQRTNPLQLSSRVAMTAAASGSNGIQVLDNEQVNFGTGNFTLHWEGSLPVWDGSTGFQNLIRKQIDASITFGCTLLVSGANPGQLGLLFYGSSGVSVDYYSTVATGLAANANAKVTASVTRQTASADGSVTFYVNGVQLGSVVTIPASAPDTVSNTIPLYISGGSVRRTASSTTGAILYNRALSAAEVLSLAVNGPAAKDLRGTNALVLSWVNLGSAAGYETFTTSGNNITSAINSSGLGIAYISPRLDSDGNYTVTFDITVNSGSVALTIAQTLDLSSGGIAIATYTAAASTPVSVTINVPSFGGRTFLGFYAEGAVNFSVDNFNIKKNGITAHYNAQDAQSNTGQVFDSSGNGNHALLPAAGATVIGRPLSAPRRIEWRNTWAATSELQYVGGVNQAILENRTGFIVHDIFNTGSSVDVNIGDGSSATRFASGVTLAAGPNRVTLATPFTDGTNRKLTITPTASFTGSLITSATYQLVRAS